jgi:hypothetical protein
MARPAIIAPREDHGTRVCYVGGCRCDDCLRANRDHYRERQRRMVELAAEVRPSGPPLPGTLLREGREIRVLRCPGANGAACVRGGTWLRGQSSTGVCGVCVERATVWDGLVSPERARAHLMQLRRAGVGYKAVAAACDVSASTLTEILDRVGPIRASTERRILAVDTGARADGARIDAKKTNRLIAEILAKGFTRRHVATLIGYSSKATALQVGKGKRVTASTAARVAKLARRIERGEVQPVRATADATAERAWLVGLLDRGVDARWLSARLGFFVQRSSTGRMKHANLAAVRAFRAELEELAREGTGMPEGWESARTSGITAAFGFEGGWSWSYGSSGGKRKKRAKPKPVPKPPREKLSDDERRRRSAERMRARRAKMDPEALRARKGFV